MLLVLLVVGVVGCWLLVVGCWLLVVGCWLLVVGCWLLVVGCWLLVVGCWLLVVGCWLLVVGCWLLSTQIDETAMPMSTQPYDLIGRPGAESPGSPTPGDSGTTWSPRALTVVSARKLEKWSSTPGQREER